MRTVAHLVLTLSWLSVLLVACGAPDESAVPTPGPVIQFASGGADAGPWTAVIYAGPDGSTCVEFRWAGDRRGGSCGPLDVDYVTRDAGWIWITGSTRLLAAKSVRVTEVDGNNGSGAVTDAILPAPGVTNDVRYYATALSGGSNKAKITTVEILNAAGTVLQTRPVNRP